MIKFKHGIIVSIFLSFLLSEIKMGYLNADKILTELDEVRQVQIQLEVCDKEMCDFYQCKFENNILVNSSLNTIFRNKVWFNKIIHKLKIFHNDLMYSLKHNKINRKRKRYDTYIDWSQYINIENISNYINNDPLLDYLELYGNIYEKNYRKDNENHFYNYIKTSLEKFKSNIFNKISYSVIVCKTKQYKSYELFENSKLW